MRRFWHWLDTRAALRTVQLGVVLAVVSVAGLYVQDRRHQDCLERYNEATSAVSRERTDAINKDWAALDELVRQSETGGEAYQQAARDYLANRAQTLKQREQHPLVPPPSDFCS